MSVQPLRDVLANAKDQAKGKRVTNAALLIAHIDSTPAWKAALRFNEFSGDIECCDQFPPEQVVPSPAMRPFRDPADLLEALVYFQQGGFPKATKTTVWDALLFIAHRHAYHPVRNYLDSLQWDGTPRVGKLFQHYFNAELPAKQIELAQHITYLEHISRGFMVSAVARVQQPGCKVDHVPVLVGDEDLFKSSVIRALCPDPTWFFDNLPPDLGERDTKEALVGKWIIELSEFPHVRREAERVKAFFSCQVDRYRAPYGRSSADHPRQCVFIATSNDLEFIDVTGNRRFWPFHVASAADIDAIVRDRDQLWAEATALYCQGTQWWLAPDIKAIAKEKQASFVETDIWDGLIKDWVARHPYPFTMEHLFAYSTGITPYRETAATSRADEMRAARCLKKLGFRKRQETVNGKRATWWHRP